MSTPIRDLLSKLSSSMWHEFYTSHKPEITALENQLQENEQQIRKAMEWMANRIVWDDYFAESAPATTDIIDQYFTEQLQGKLYRCEGCGEFLEYGELSSNGSDHIVSVSDKYGGVTHRVCGPVRRLSDAEKEVDKPLTPEEKDELIAELNRTKEEANKPEKSSLEFEEILSLIDFITGDKIGYGFLPTKDRNQIAREWCGSAKDIDFRENDVQEIVIAWKSFIRRNEYADLDKFARELCDSVRDINFRENDVQEKIVAWKKGHADLDKFARELCKKRKGEINESVKKNNKRNA